MSKELELNLIRKLAVGLVRRRMPFTAYDVTTSLRGQGVRIEHKVVRQGVHDLFSSGGMGDYGRGQASLPGVKAQPYVYHPPGFDPSSYDGVAKAADLLISAIQQTVAPAKKVVPATQATPATPATPRSPPDGAKKVVPTKDGRIYLPARMVRSLGFQPRTAAWGDVSSSVIRVGQTQGASSVRLYVDGNCNIRISRKVFGGSFPAQSFDVKIDGSGLEVVPV